MGPGGIDPARRGRQARSQGPLIVPPELSTACEESLQTNSPKQVVENSAELQSGEKETHRIRYEFGPRSGERTI
jgi:hypothetical protein